MGILSTLNANTLSAVALSSEDRQVQERKCGHSDFWNKKKKTKLSILFFWICEWDVLRRESELLAKSKYFLSIYFFLFGTEDQAIICKVTLLWNAWWYCTGLLQTAVATGFWWGVYQDDILTRSELNSNEISKILKNKKRLHKQDQGKLRIIFFATDTNLSEKGCNHAKQTFFLLRTINSPLMES